MEGIAIQSHNSSLAPLLLMGDQWQVAIALEKVTWPVTSQASTLSTPPLSSLRVRGHAAVPRPSWGCVKGTLFRISAESDKGTMWPCISDEK